MMRRFALALLVVGLAMTSPSSAAAQWITFTGSAETGGELYGVQGIQARRPGSSWRVAMRPQVTLFGAVSGGLELLLTNEGNAFRQNMNQIGFNPRFGWATLHLGDFTQAYTDYTVSGIRVRGAGMTLTPGWFRFAVQGGQTQRPVFAGAEGNVYQRVLVAGKMGVGHDDRHFLDLHVVKAQDLIGRVERNLTVIDSTLLDTLPSGAFRPQIGTRPQENLVTSVTGQLRLLDGAFTLRGEGSAALTNNDLAAERIDSVVAGPARFLRGLQPLRLSSSGDVAYKVDAAWQQRRLRVRTQYEWVGPGYTSLGLAYLIADRRSLGGDVSTQVLGDRLTLQGQLRRQNDNLLDQRATTTTRDLFGGAVLMRITDRLNAGVNATLNTIGNTAVVDTFVVDVRALAAAATLSWQSEWWGRKTTLSGTLAQQTSTDGNVVTNVPDVSATNLNVTVQTNVTDRFSVAPSLAFVRAKTTPGLTADNLQLGLRVNGTVFRDRVQVGGGVTDARTTNGRAVRGMTLNASWALPGDVRAVLAARSNTYAAFGSSPRFIERVANLSMSRSF
jgi:hypothetical protein